MQLNLHGYISIKALALHKGACTASSSPGNTGEQSVFRLATVCPFIMSSADPAPVV